MRSRKNSNRTSSGPAESTLGKHHPPPMVLPLTVSEPMTLHGFNIYPDAHSTFRYFALNGKLQADGTPVAIVQAEAPLEDPSMRRRANTKAAQEIRDVKNFLSATGISQKTYKVKPGPHPNEPPDVIATFGTESVAIEATQMHIPGSATHPHLNGIGLARAFEGLVKSIAAQSSSLHTDLQAHRGFMLFLSFGESDGPSSGLPPRARDNARLIEVIDFLRATEPPLEFLPHGVNPEPRYRHNDIRYNDAGTVGVTWHLAERLNPDSAVTKALGFELGLLHNREIRQADAVKEFQRLVKGHDKQELDYLVVTIGSPTKDGWLYPSDQACAYILENTIDPLAGYMPNNIDNIAIHDLTQGGKVRWVLGGPSRIATLGQRSR